MAEVSAGTSSEIEAKPAAPMGRAEPIGGLRAGLSVGGEVACRAVVAILGGVLVALLVQGVVMAAGESAGAVGHFARSMGRVTWSVGVCAAIAVAMTIRRMNPGFVGLVGLVSAPIALQAAKAVQKGLAAGVPLVGTMPPPPGPLELAIVRAIEYGALALLVALWAVPRGWRAHLTVGAVVGAVFTGYSLARMSTSDGVRAGDLGVRAVTEFVHPIGCAAILWAAAHAGTVLRRFRGRGYTVA